MTLLWTSGVFIPVGSSFTSPPKVISVENPAAFAAAASSGDSPVTSSTDMSSTES